MKCVVCGKEFSPRHKNHKCCSASCAEKKYRQSAPLLTITCEYCGKQFTAQWSTRRFCSKSCAAKSRCDKLRSICRSPKQGKTIDEWAREARECNLDYGTYRALIERGKTFDELRAERDRHSTPAHAHCTYHYHK